MSIRLITFLTLLAMTSVVVAQSPPAKSADRRTSEKPTAPERRQKAAADKEKSAKASVSEARKAAKAAAAEKLAAWKLTPQKEKIAQKFARQHHPELLDLLADLRDMQVPDYIRAVRELCNESERLAQFEKKQPERYERELSYWKVDSRVRLLVARWRNDGQKADVATYRSQLAKLIAQKQDLRLKQVHAEKKRTQQRLKTLDDTIQRMESKRDGVINAELTRLTRGLEKRSSRKQREMKTQPVKKERDQTEAAKSESIPATKLRPADKKKQKKQQ